MSAVGTLITMSAEGGGAAAGDGQQHFPVLPVYPPTTAVKKRLSSTANNVGHLQRCSGSCPEVLFREILAGF